MMRFWLCGALFIGCAGLTLAQETTWKPVSFAEADARATELLKQMTTEEKQLQLLSYKNNGVPRLGIPNLNAGEALHGVVSGGCTSFPMSISLGATWDPDLMKQIGEVVAKEARAVGMEQAFAPMLGLARDARWGRVEESYGEDPYLVSRIGVSYIEGLQGMGPDRFSPDHIIATPKHFVADGEPWAGANGEDFETSERVLREIYFPPFEAAVKEAQCGSVMPGHHALNGVPCHSNPWLLTDILRKEWGFTGFMTSDMGDIPKIAGGHHFATDDEDAAVKALSAGVDMELVGNLYAHQLGKAIQEGKISLDIVNEAARRVLREKIQLLGLQPPSANSTDSLDQTQATIINHQGPDDVWAKLVAEGKLAMPAKLRRPDADAILNDPTHAALALKAAQEEMVLLKNEGHLLPLNKDKVQHLLLVGPLADMVNLGNYSGAPKNPVSIRKGLETYLGADKMTYVAGCRLTQQANDPDLAKAVEAAKTADVIVAVVGFTSGQARENLDRDTLDLIGGQEALVEAMMASGKPVVVVLSNGAPVSVCWIQKNVPAVLEAWYGGQAAGTALAQILFGEVNPSGKLNVSFPRNVGQVPCYYDHLPLTGPVGYFRNSDDPLADFSKKFDVLWAFGHGLSYTTFEYSGLNITPAEIGQDQTASVSFTVKNTGSIAGEEVAQMYLRQDFTSLVRPVLELKAFQRVSLKPGESKTVTFPVGFEQFKFWKEGKWVAEAGKIQVKIGGGSDALPLNGSVAWK